VDELEGQAIIRRRLQGAEEIHGLGVEPAVAYIPVATNVAAKKRVLEIADLLAG
jgi:hypothetical protein